MTIQNYQRDALNIIYSSNIITLLYMFRVSSAHLQEDIVVHKQPMVLSLSIRVLVSCWYAARVHHVGSFVWSIHDARSEKHWVNITHVLTTIHIFVPRPYGFRGNRSGSSSRKYYASKYFLIRCLNLLSFGVYLAEFSHFFCIQ